VANEAEAVWERIKAEEKRARRQIATAGILDGVPSSLPSVLRAQRLQNEASTVGFDWNDPKAVLAKLREEIDEVEAELEAADSVRLADEVGDLMFAVVNLARHLKVDADQALRRTNAKFIKRFRSIEAALAAQGRSPNEATLDEMETLWRAAKEI
jgi:ATP diphosphatase